MAVEHSDRLKKRAEFLAVARGRRVPRRGFVLQFAQREIKDPNVDTATETAGHAIARFGYTVTKKTGNSVVRNRIRRRLREAVRLSGRAIADPLLDHVLIGRREALTLSFADLCADLAGALRATRKPPKSR